MQAFAVIWKLVHEAKPHHCKHSSFPVLLIRNSDIWPKQLNAQHTAAICLQFPVGLFPEGYPHLAPMTSQTSESMHKEIQYITPFFYFSLHVNILFISNHDVMNMPIPKHIYQGRRYRGVEGASPPTFILGGQSTPIFHQGWIQQHGQYCFSHTNFWHFRHS